MFARGECIVACLSETQSLPTVTFKEGLGKNRQRDLEGRETSSAAHLYNPPAMGLGVDSAPYHGPAHTGVDYVCKLLQPSRETRCRVMADQRGASARTGQIYSERFRLVVRSCRTDHGPWLQFTLLLPGSS